MFCTFNLFNLVCKKWVRSRDRKFSKSQEGILIIIIPHENARYAILCQAGIVTNATQISAIFIFMMKTTKNYAVFNWIISIHFKWREIIQTTVVRDWTFMTFIKMCAGGGIWTHESLRNRDLGILNVIHSKLRTRLSRDLRRWPSLATPASNCLLVYLMKVGRPNLSII